MNREEIINILTEEQKNEINILSGIGKSQHFLGGPQLANVHKNNINIGWGQSIYNGVGVLQTTTDLENWSKIIEIYNPDIFIEMGVANGGNILYINDLLVKNNKNPILIGVDIDNSINEKCNFLKNFTFLNDSTLSNKTIEYINNIIIQNKEKKVLIHFDDNHISSHVFNELQVYSKIIKTNDVIIVGDTWDEGWYDSPFVALCDFIKDNEDFSIDVTTHKKMSMPCNWVFGILIKK